MHKRAWFVGESIEQYSMAGIWDTVGKCRDQIKRMDLGDGIKKRSKEPWKVI